MWATTTVAGGVGGCGGDVGGMGEVWATIEVGRCGSGWSARLEAQQKAGTTRGGAAGDGLSSARHDMEEVGGPRGGVVSKNTAGDGGRLSLRGEAGMEVRPVAVGGRRRWRCALAASCGEHGQPVEAATMVAL
uniref:DUF834 domain-containing protein n=1 Tax=Oryza punctata TaxID=4537 RepID=A0A0E0MP61_ORYPU